MKKQYGLANAPGTTSQPRRPVVTRVAVDESGLDAVQPTWLHNAEDKLDNASLKEIVLVGSSPEETADPEN